MCTSSPRAGKAPPPPAAPESLDPQANAAALRERRRGARGQQSTILTSGDATVTAGQKTLLGS